MMCESSIREVIITWRRFWNIQFFLYRPIRLSQCDNSSNFGLKEYLGTFICNSVVSLYTLFQFRPDGAYGMFWSFPSVRTCASARFRYSPETWRTNVISIRHGLCYSKIRSKSCDTTGLVSSCGQA